MSVMASPMQRATVVLRHVAGSAVGIAFEALLCIATVAAASDGPHDGVTGVLTLPFASLALAVSLLGFVGPYALPWVVVRRAGWLWWRRRQGTTIPRSVEALSVLGMQLAFAAAVPGPIPSARFLLPIAVFHTVEWWLVFALCHALTARLLGRRPRGAVRRD